MTETPDPEATPRASDAAPSTHPVPPTYPVPPTHPALSAYPVPPAYPAATGGQGHPPAFPPPAFPPPVSAVPVSAYPTTGYPGYPIPQPPTRKGPWLWVLAGLCTVLAAGIGALGYLIAAEHASSRAAIVEQDAEIEDLQSRIRQRDSDNQAIQDTNDDYNTSLGAQEELLADLRECPAAVQAYVDAAVAGDEAAFEQAVNDMINICHI